MLHMVVMTHTAESCPFRSPENSKAMTDALGRIAALAKEYQAELTGSWGNTGAHRMFTLVEAPTAHSVNELLQASGLTGLGIFEVYAVAPMALIEPRLEALAVSTPS